MVVRAQTADPIAFVRFRKTHSGSLTFLLQINDARYACVAPSMMKDVWMAALGGAGFFTVQYDSLGRCILAEAITSSDHKNAL